MLRRAARQAELRAVNSRCEALEAEAEQARAAQRAAERAHGKLADDVTSQASCAAIEKAAVRELVGSLADSCKGQFRAAEQRLDQCESDGAALKAELSRRAAELGSLIDKAEAAATWPTGNAQASGNFSFTPGGRGGNESVAIARLGVRTTLISRVGEDDYGREVRAPPCR